MNYKLPAAAAAALLAGTVSAADITMFGFLDQGLAYIHEDLNAGMASPVGQPAAASILQSNGKVGAAGTKTGFSQGTGNVSTWGMKGSEKLTDDLDVVFHLESGFLADDGTFYGGSTMFERESTLGLRSKTFGELKAGRMPALTTGSGTTGIFNSRVNPFGAGWGNMTGGWKFAGTLAQARWNNMINWISPSWRGVRLYAQHSLGNKSGADEGSVRVDRWSAVGASVTADRYYFAAAVDWIKAGSANPAGQAGKDAWKALAGGHWKVDDDVKVFGTVQYLKNVPWIGGYSTKEWAPRANKEMLNMGFEAWALATGLDWKAAGGTVKASVAYAWGENQNVDSDNKMKRANAGLGYVYPLSRRTSVYAIGGYFWQDADWQDSSISAHEAIVGLMHRF